MIRLYRIDDQKKQTGVVECKDIADAKYWNERGWGIFSTPNDFIGARRVENLERINSWYIDIDGCNKPLKLAEIKKSVIEPSIIVETKSGYHCYWLAAKATVHNFSEIEKRLINYFNADPQVKDLPRLLRVPGFYHCKDINNKFLITNIYTSEKVLSEKVMLGAFPKVKDIEHTYENINIKDIDFNNLSKLLKPEYICDGERNGRIFKKGVFLKKLGATYDQVDVALEWLNNNISDPIPKGELRAIIKGYPKWTN